MTTESRTLTPEEMAARIVDLQGALLAACNYMECAIPNLGRKASQNYSRTVSTYRKIAAGLARFSDLQD